MTKLERLCRNLEAANRGEDYSVYQQATRELAHWVHKLWYAGRLNADKITMSDEKEPTMRTIEEIKEDIATVQGFLPPGYTNTDMCVLETELRLALTASIPLDRLEQICNAERSNSPGGVGLPPCRIGETLYQIDDGELYEDYIDQITICKDLWTIASYDIRPEDWGKTAFTTRAAADAALAGQEEGRG